MGWRDGERIGYKRRVNFNRSANNFKVSSGRTRWKEGENERKNVRERMKDRERERKRVRVRERK